MVLPCKWLRRLRIDDLHDLLHVDVFLLANILKKNIQIQSMDGFSHQEQDSLYPLGVQHRLVGIPGGVPGYPGKHSQFAMEMTVDH